MNIGIVGSGKVGRALGSWLATLGHSVAFSSRTQEHASEAAIAAGNSAGHGSIQDVIRKSEIILLTLPYKEIAGALSSVQSGLEGRTLVDVTNPISEDRRSLNVGRTDSGAEQIARRFPSAHVVKAFNTVFAEVYMSQNPRMEGRAVSICFAGDEANSKALVRRIIEDMGFDPVDAGPLSNSRFLEPLSLLNIQLGRFLGYGTQIGFSLLKRS